MNFTRRVVLASASAAALTLSVSSAAVAQTEIYGGGATLPSLVLRDLFNCWGRTVDNAAGDFTNAAACDDTTKVTNRIFGYASVGSGRGLVSFTTRSSTGLGIPAPTETVPYTTVAGGPACTPPLTSPDARAAIPATGLAFDCAAPNPPSGYTRHHYSSSEQPLPQVNAARPIESLTCYEGGAGCAADQRVVAGEAIQVPFAVAPVNVPYNLPGFAGPLRLSERTLCGIFTGGITNWNDSRISSENGGSVTGGTPRPIRVVRRSDSSGTSFLFVNHLEAVCTIARTGFDWTGGVSTLPTWPVQAFFYAAAGNAGVAGTVAEEPFTIGYASPSFTQYPDAVGTVKVDVASTLNISDAIGANPITVTAGLYDAADPATLRNKNGQYRTPTLANATRGMGSATPPTGAAALDPANWATAGVVPDPTALGSYPIVGFAWLMHYSCYASNNVVGGLRAWWSWNIANQAGGNLDARDLLRDRGFAVLPTNWRTAVRNHILVTDASELSGVAGSGLRNPNCIGKPGA